MGKEYIIEKKNFLLEDINFIYVFFNNRDFVTIKSKEIEDISLKFFDNLVVENDSICRVAESGFIKINISNSTKLYNCENFVYNPKEYNKDRKKYIENRICNENDIKCIRIFDENNWHDTIYGETESQIDGEYLIINFIRKSNIALSDNNKNKIFLPDITKKVIKKINLDFENCDGFTIYQEEIVDLFLNFKNELVWGSGDLNREIKSGYIKLLIDDKIPYRNINVYNIENTKNVKKTKLEKRLLGDHDICHLYIHYDSYGYGDTRCECIEIYDLQEYKNDDEDEDDLCFVGGYCEKTKNGEILITFGEEAKKLLKQRI